MFLPRSLGHLSDRQQLRGPGADEQLLQVFHARAVACLRGTEDPVLDAPYDGLRCGPAHAGPRPHRLSPVGLFGSHRLTSPTGLASRSMASAETCRKSAPFRAGSPPLARALSAPLQGGLRLFRLSSTPPPSPSLAVGLPSCDGTMGLTLLPEGRCDRGGCALSSGGSWCHRRWCHLAIRPADLCPGHQPLGPVLRLRTLDGRSLALSLSVSARADPDRGFQASAHCSRRSASDCSSALPGSGPQVNGVFSP